MTGPEKETNQIYNLGQIVWVDEVHKGLRCAKANYVGPAKIINVHCAEKRCMARANKYIDICRHCIGKRYYMVMIPTLVGHKEEQYVYVDDNNIKCVMRVSTCSK